GRVADVAAHLLPRRRRVRATRLDEGSSLLGDHEQPAPVDLLGADQPLVLELRQGRVDRAGPGSPHALAALLHLLHDLLAVTRLLGQEQQRRRADVATARLAPGAERATAGRAEGKAASPRRPEVAMAFVSRARTATGTRHRVPQPGEVVRVAAPAVRRARVLNCVSKHVVLLS